MVEVQVFTVYAIRKAKNASAIGKIVGGGRRRGFALDRPGGGVGKICRLVWLVVITNR